MRLLVALLSAVLLLSGCGTAVPPASPGQSPAPQPSQPGEQTPPTTQPPQSPLAALISELRSDATRQPIDAATQAELEALVAADTDFALRLYLEVAAAQTDNVFISPYSISTALSMAYAGARGNTADQIARVLGIDLDAATWHAARNRLELEMIARAAQPPPAEDAVPLVLEPANAIFGQTGFPFNDAFLETLAASYGAGMQTVDFARRTEEARVAINEWVAERTRERIEELLAPGVLDELSRAVLVNAIYFKGSWQQPFDPDQTRPMDFHLLDGSAVDVPMMHTLLATGYSSGDGWQAVRVPYFGASMLVIVPDDGRFEEVEQGLDAGFLTEVERTISDFDVDLGLPRWESENSIELAETLRALGIVDAFDPEVADLSGIAPVDDLHVSDVIHQANVTVDEEGTEAAAATAVVIGVTGAPPELPRVTLTVDRPFLYLIQDDATSEVLFIGRLLSP